MAATLSAACVEAGPAPAAGPAGTSSWSTEASPLPETSLGTEAGLGTGDVVGYEIGTVEVAGATMVVAIADTPELRGRGLMGVEDLGDLDGMLFVMPDERLTAFTMRHTLIPLDIAFFDDSGRLVDLLTMEPCAGEPCPLHRAAAPFRYALETPAEELAGLAAGATLVITDG